jgi:hypothetical protein
MKRCLSDKSLLECYSGDGQPNDLIHLEDCRFCASRYQALQGDMSLIARALESAPPARKAGSVLRWRVAVSIAAVAAAFVFGWSLRGASLGPSQTSPAQLAYKPASRPIQLAAQPRGIQPARATSAMYAAYVQDAFASDPCAEANDPLAPGCL